MNIIEKAFIDKSNDFPAAKKYEQQWELAKGYIPQVLDTIAHYFPHYSLHDATHSETILNNIVMILGEDVIRNLSVVDLWLLISSAYYHDIGMTVSGKDKTKLLVAGSDFANYLTRVSNDEHSPLQKYSKLFEVKDGKVYYKNNELTPDNIDAQRFLLADYLRPEHAERSSEKILSEDSLHLPGDPIPERMIKLLSSICRAHTQKREDLLSLPLEEYSGCGIETCHPRFIACMLRLGDLLDIDTNRVSSVLLSTLPSIPVDSMSYNQTNRDITHIQIGRSVIELTAECDDIKVAELLNEWFKMIDDELSFQSKNWYKIVPSVGFGSLPSAGQLIVKLKGYDDISGKNRLRFQIDNAKAIEMLQGAGLYSDASQCVRELLQNAVDATYLRIYLENPDIQDLVAFREKCKEKKIVVEFNKVGVTEGKTNWHLSIVDSGLGMSLQDIAFLTKTGSSNKNIERNMIIEKMPVWMRPSGVFGIGFQSVFLITDKVLLQTRKWGKEETIYLELNNPAGPGKGNILKRTVKDSKVPFGTKIECDIEFSALSSWTVHQADRASIETIATYDFARDESLDVDAAKIVDEIERFADLSYVNIELRKNGEIKEYRPQGDTVFEFFDTPTSIQVSLGSRYVGTSLYYRNQYVSKFNSGLTLLDFSINLLSGYANDILDLSRNDIKKDAKQKIMPEVKKAVIRYINDKYEKFDEEIKYEGIYLKPRAAAFLETHKDFIIRYSTELPQFFPTEWLLLEIPVQDEKAMLCTKSIKDLLQYDVVKYFSTNNRELCFLESGKTEPHFTACNSQISHDIFDFLCSILYKSFTDITYTSECIILSKEKVGELIADDVEAKKRWFRMYMHHGTYARGYMPCLPKYEALMINEYEYDTFGIFGMVKNAMVCPYIREVDEDIDIFWTHKKLKYVVDSSVINYVYERRNCETTSIEDIKNAYEAFHEDFQPIIDMINKAD